MKRRKRKRKPKPEPKPAEQVSIPSEREQPATPGEVQAEATDSAIPAEIQLETEDTAIPIEIQDEIESFVSAADAQAESEIPAPPVAIHDEAEKAPGPVATQTEAENPPSPAEIPPSRAATLADAKKAAPPRAPATAADRRAHPRYAFTAAIEVAAAEPGPGIKMRVRDLSQEGCYVDTDNPLALGTDTAVRITKSGNLFEARARVVYNLPGKGMGLMFTAVEPEHRVTLSAWIAESRETSWLAANRRRSQRVLMKLPVRVTGQVGAGESFEEDTHTLAISAHGALLVVAAPVYRGQRFTLSNIQTKAALECVVVHVDRILGEQIQVGVEFLLPNPTFWRVAFPPKDWTPRHPDAKSG